MIKAKHHRNTCPY